MEVISNLLQAAVTLLGFFLGGIRYLKSRKQEYLLSYNINNVQNQ